LYYAGDVVYLAFPEEDVKGDELTVFLYESLQTALLQEIVGLLL